MKPAYQISPQSLTLLPRSIQHPGYRKFVRQLPCLVCGQNWSIEFCHIGPRGLGQKASDLDGIPLCRLHHQHGPESLHVLGPIRFQQAHGLEFCRIIAGLQARAVACGLDFGAGETPRKRMGRVGGFRRRGVA